MSPPELVEMAEREIGVPATWWAAQTAQRIVDDVAARFRESSTPVMVTGSEREGCEASLLTVLVGLHKEIPSVSRSGSVTENVRQSVHRGVSVNTVLKTVWACHAMAQDALLSEVERVLPGERLISEVRRLTRAIRETLRVYLRNGASRTATAKDLYIAVNTVSYRVAKASDLLGRPAGERPVETLLALELAHYFPDFLA